jgi:hypothetical protein
MEKYYLNQQPWANYKEWKSCYDYLFNNKYGDRTGKKIDKTYDNLNSFIDDLNMDDLFIGKKILRIWGNRGDNISLIRTTSLLLDEIIKIKENKTDEHVMAQKIIRVTNLIIDNYKKKNKGSGNMFLVAKELNFPEFIIETRHSCTHKELPEANTLIYNIKYLYFWIKVNIWDGQYNLYEKEISLYNMLCDVILHMKNVNNVLSDIENIDLDVRLEVDRLIRVCNLLTKSFIDHSKVENLKTRKTVNTKNMNEYQRIYKAIFNQEGDIVLLIIFKDISDKILEIVSVSLNEDKTILEDKSDYFYIMSYFLNTIVKLSPISKTFELKELVKTIYERLYFCRDFSQNITKIYETYIQYYKSHITEIPKVLSEYITSISQNEKNSKITPGTLIFTQLEALQNPESMKKMVETNKTHSTDLNKINHMNDITMIDIDSTLIL